MAAMPRFLSVLGVSVLRSVPLRQMAGQVRSAGAPCRAQQCRHWSSVQPAGERAPTP